MNDRERVGREGGGRCESASLIKPASHAAPAAAAAAVDTPGFQELNGVDEGRERGGTSEE